MLIATESQSLTSSKKRSRTTRNEENAPFNQTIEISFAQRNKTLAYYRSRTGFQSLIANIQIFIEKMMKP